MTTKERILDEALLLFSQQGYDAVGVEEIAAAVGIKAPSLYKHFRGKKDIFDAIFAEMQRRYAEQTEGMQLHFEDGAADREKFAAIDADGLVAQVQAVLRYSLHDPYVSRCRRLVSIEQFRSPELSALYTQRYVDRMVNYHKALFTHLMAAGAMREGDAHSLALQYVCPVLILLSVCDRQPEKEAEAMAQVEAHIRQFWTLTQPDTPKHERSTHEARN